jgi:hypothetical protein
MTLPYSPHHRQLLLRKISHHLFSKPNFPGDNVLEHATPGALTGDSGACYYGDMKTGMDDLIAQISAMQERMGNGNCRRGAEAPALGDSRHAFAPSRDSYMLSGSVKNPQRSPFPDHPAAPKRGQAPAPETRS